MMAKQMLTAAVLSIAGAAMPAAANDWYPPACQSFQVCAPVFNMAWINPDRTDGPLVIVSSLHGNAVVPINFKAQKSQDERVHVCLQYDPFGTLEVTCLLVPARLF
jgi:hypothetical protein